MPAGKEATQIPQVAALQHWLPALARKTAHSVFIGLIICSCHSAQAADLPHTFSDSAPSPEGPLNQSPVLQTNSKVLPIDSAFALTSFIEADTNIVLRWEMPAGYYLYQKSLMVENAAGETISLELPTAEKITDEFFGEVSVYHNSLLLRLPFTVLNATPGTTVDLLLSYQGCAEDVYCYPPVQKALTLKLPE